MRAPARIVACVAAAALVAACAADPAATPPAIASSTTPQLTDGGDDVPSRRLHADHDAATRAAHARIRRRHELRGGRSGRGWTRTRRRSSARRCRCSAWPTSRSATSRRRSPSAASPKPKTYTFRAPATAFDALELAGFDAVSMANNHGVDFGAVGLRTRSPRSARPIGRGRRASAPTPTRRTRRSSSRRRAGASRSSPRSSCTTRPGGTGARPTRPLAWPATTSGSSRGPGRGRRRPTSRSPTCTGRRRTRPAPTHDVAPRIVDELIAAGADMVVGAHAHMLQGAGWRDRVFVAYGLGNYLWYFQRDRGRPRAPGSSPSPWTSTTTPVAYDYAPARIQTPSGIPLPMAGAEADDARQQFEDLRSGTEPSRRQPRCPAGGSARRVEPFWDRLGRSARVAERVWAGFRSGSVRTWLSW